MILLDGKSLLNLSRKHVRQNGTCGAGQHYGTADGAVFSVGTACSNVSAMLSKERRSASRTSRPAISVGNSIGDTVCFGGSTANTYLPSALAAPASNRTLFRFAALRDGITKIKAFDRSISVRSTSAQTPPGAMSV